MDNLESPSTALPFEVYWSEFLEQYRSSSARLIAELESCWADVQGILEGQLRQIETRPGAGLASLDLDTFQKTREELSQRILIEPLSQWDRRRPFKRVQMAFDRYERSLAELVRSLPSTLSLNGPQVLEVLQDSLSHSYLRRIAGLRPKARRLSLDSLLADELRQLDRQRLKTEGEYLLVLLFAYRQLKRNWEQVRAALDASVTGGALQGEAAKNPHQVESSNTLSLHQAQDALDAWHRWPELSVQRFSERILSAVVWRSRSQGVKHGDRRAAVGAHWAKQLRAVEAELSLEQSLERTERRILSLSRRSIESAGQELASLTSELESFISWLRERPAKGVDGNLPVPAVTVAPGSSRLAELLRELEWELNSLPETCDAFGEFSVWPERRSRRQLTPRLTFHETFRRVGQQRLSRVFEEIETHHRRIIQEIERAREVVSFGTGSENGEDLDAEVAQEAMRNALSLLEFRRAELGGWQASASTMVTQTLGDVFNETRLILSRDRLGVFTYLAQQGLRRALPLASRNALSGTVRFLRQGYKVSEQAVLMFLVYIGWKQEVRAGRAHVTKRAYLPEEFVVDLEAKELPSIYRRLFRFEPVQDPRFLVGRERELNAVAEARSFWEAGRPVALIIVGERGSGKTSLINCALKQVLDGLEVIRGEFSQRLLTEAQLTDFLARLGGMSGSAHVLEFFSERRRVVILEELERTFLRQVGCYAALRALQRLIAATCSTTLWILIVNQVAFKFLDATVRLGESFSHRIDAAGASREALQQAIMLRHNLSGLRLQFAFPPSHDHPLQRLKALVHGQASPESVFFATLAKASGGAFRTAFDIWLGQIDRVESGLLYMKPLLLPDLSPLIGALDIADLFTLVAILQHGSLTPEEHARIFQKTIMRSRAQMDELLAREIVELDPGRPGFRVRPEALRVVHEALYRRNLL